MESTGVDDINHSAGEMIWEYLGFLKLMSSRLHWFKFAPAAWLNDPDLSRCSRAARGFWIDALCVLFEAEECGVFKTNGVPWTDREISAAVRGDDEGNLVCLTEVLAKGVATRSKDGAVLSRRMVRDEEKRRKCGEAGKKGGGNPTYKGQPKGGCKGSIKGRSKGASNSNSSESDSDSEEEKPKATFKGPSTAFDIEEIVERIAARHPKKRGVEWGKRRIVEEMGKTPEPQSLLERIDRQHAKWCACSDWRGDPKFVPQLGTWITEGGHFDPDPPIFREVGDVPLVDDDA